MTLEQLAVAVLAVGAVGLSYLLLRRPRGRRMRHAVGAGPLPAADVAAPTLLVPDAGAPHPDLSVGRRHAAAQAFPLDSFPPEPFPLEPFPLEPFPLEPFPLEPFPVDASPAGPRRVVQLPPDPGPAEPASQHAWMGPDGLVIPMPGRDSLNPTGRH